MRSQISQKSHQYKTNIFENPLIEEVTEENNSIIQW